MGMFSLLALFLGYFVAELHAQSFLETQLPLVLTTTTPLELLSGTQAVRLDGQQTLTAVFSRPVQALGSGFGTSKTPDQPPFRLVGCKVPGRFRWPTTYIARFDPDIPWPTDLNCTLVWNNIKAYDGVSLSLPAAKKVPIITNALTVSLVNVDSPIAQKLTDGLWQANVGSKEDKLPEVPPDGSLSAGFSYPVDLQMVAKVFKVYQLDGKAQKPTNIQVKAGNCTVQTNRPMDYPVTKAGTVSISDTSGSMDSRGISTAPQVMEIDSRGISTAPQAMEIDSRGISTAPHTTPTCVQLNLTKPLKADTYYQICIPAGVSYHPYAGKPPVPVCMTVAGLRKFHIPLKQLKKGSPESEMVTFRRLDLWLPHGLHPSVKASAFASAVKLCQVVGTACQPIKLTPSLPGKAILRITVPTLLPATTYRLSIAASQGIKDGYGQSLQASSTEFTTMAAAAILQGVAHNNPVVTLEAGIPEVSNLSWPLLSYGKDADINQAAVWASGNSSFSKILPTVAAQYDGYNGALNLNTELGKPDKQVQVPDGVTLFQTSLALKPTGPWALQTCCRKQQDINNKEVQASADIVLVQLSGVMASAVVVNRKLHLLVSSASGPVDNVEVDVYLKSSQAPLGPKLGSVKTNGNGMAVYPLASDSDTPNYIVVVTPKGASPVILPIIDPDSPEDPAQYQASLVLDRKLAREGETVYVSGVIRWMKGSNISLPVKPSFTLLLSPDPSPDVAQDSTFTKEIVVDQAFGTFTAELKIPTPAKYTDYLVSLRPSNDSTTAVVGTASFTVANPRPPTVALDLTVPAWVVPKGKLPLSVKTVSYLGNVVGGAAVGVAWTVSGQSGVLNLTTDGQGVAKGVLDLASLPSGSPSVGDSVSLTAEWVGPTRERVVKEAAVSVTPGRYTVEVGRSINTQTPGVPFALSAVVMDNSNSGAAVTAGDVTVSIVAAKTAKKPACALPPPCKLPAGTQLFSKCMLALPCVGDFELQSCYKGDCSNSRLGVNATVWATRPLGSFDDIKLVADKVNYTVGQTAKLSWHLPRPAAAVMLVWGNNNAVFTQVLPQAPAGVTSTTIKLPSEALGGLTIKVVAHFARSQLPLPKVPISRFFDFNGPAALTAEISIVVNEDNKLTLNITAPRELQPGESGNIKVKVTGGEATRVTVLAVDQAVLDLMPYPLPDPSFDLTVRINTYMQFSSLTRTWRWAGAITAVFQRALRLLAQDPWLNVADLLTSDLANQGDMSDEEYLSLNTFLMTAFPEFVAPGRLSQNSLEGFVTFSGSTPLMVDLLSTGPAPLAKTAQSAAEPSGVRVGAEFVATPLFTVVTIAAGQEGVVVFKAPTNLGKFAIRAFAATGASTKVGSAETQLVVRRKLSLTPSLPRFVRSNDAFQAGVVVSVPTAASAVKVTVTAQLVGGDKAAKLVGASTVQTTITKDVKQMEVRFSFLAPPSQGDLTVLFTATDRAGAKDSLKMAVPVAAAQEAVILGTSFSVKGSPGNTSWQEGIELPGAVAGSGSLDLTASVGYLAASQAMMMQLVPSKPEKPEGYWAVAAAMYQGVLTAYKQKGDAASSAAIKQALQWLLLPNAPSFPSPPSARTDISLNSWASWLVSSWPKGSLDPSLEAAGPKWGQQAADQLVQDVEQYRSATSAPWADLEGLAWVRLAVGSKWETQSPVNTDLSFKRLTANISALSTPGQVLVALTLQREGRGGDPLVSQVVKSVLSAVRVQGRTAYVASTPTGNSAADMESQALVLLMLVQADTPLAAPLVQKLAAYVAANNPPAPILYSIFATSPRTIATSQFVLSTYDRTAGNLSPNLNLTATTSPKTLLKATFNTPEARPVSTSTPWETLPSTAKTLDFSVKGEGEASVAAVMKFVPSKVLDFPTYRGLWVQRMYQAVQAGTGVPVGPPLGRVKVGSLLAVTVQVTSPDELNDVEVRVLLPGGIEAIDPSVFTDPAAQQTCSEGDLNSPSGSTRSWWWWPLCPSQETRTQMVVFKYTRFTAGTHSVKFLAVAATPGRFLDPPTRAFVSQQPELMGVTRGGMFEVCDGKGCTETAAVAAPAPKSCPGECSGNGACNIANGKCICDKGFTGGACSKPLT